MDITLVALVSITGCYSGRSADCYTQRETQAYHKDPRPVLEKAQRERLVRRIVASDRLTPMLRAAIESYMFSHCPVARWHILTNERKDAVVKEFYSAVARNAGVRLKTMANSSVEHHHRSSVAYAPA